jgi:hypothetical protein
MTVTKVMQLLPNSLRLFSYTRDGGVSRAAKGADCKSVQGTGPAGSAQRCYNHPLLPRW